MYYTLFQTRACVLWESVYVCRKIYNFRTEHNVIKAIFWKVFGMVSDFV